MSTRPPEISSHSLNRLSLYLRCLQQLQTQGIERISSQELAARFHLSAALIRKDLAQFGEFGIRGIGYEIDDLVDSLRNILGLDRIHHVAVVGVGRLGTALAVYLDTTRGAFRMVAAFDSDRRKVGKKIVGLEVSHVNDIPAVVPATDVEIALLTVPPEAASSTCEALTAAGVRGILNFAPVQLQLPEAVTTKSVDVRIHLEELAFFIQDEAVADAAE